MANLLCLATARQWFLQRHEATDGPAYDQAHARLVAYHSDQAHMSVAKAAAVIGLRAVPTTCDRRLEPVFERNNGGYAGRDPQAVLARMREDLRLLRDVPEHPHTARDRATVVRTAAGLTGLVAIIQHDRGNQQDARHWFTTAARAAAESGDRQMLAWVLARHAMVPL